MDRLNVRQNARNRVNDLAVLERSVWLSVWALRLLDARALGAFTDVTYHTTATIFSSPHFIFCSISTEDLPWL